jgi:uncharacterized protein YecT (DUF1311 family)
MKKLLPLLSLLLLSLSPAQASDGPKDQMQACMEKAPTTEKLTQCATQALKTADQDLNSLYQSLISDMAAKPKQSFVAAQVAWLKFRDSYCGHLKAYGGAEDTLNQKYLHTRCMAMLTFERNAHFSELLLSP